jgi:hypothetical protein
MKTADPESVATSAFLVELMLQKTQQGTLKPLNQQLKWHQNGISI